MYKCQNLQSLMECIIEDGHFTDVILSNNTINCYYKTYHIKYKDIKDNDVSYLFPTSFSITNGEILTRMVLGSVDNNFRCPENINGTFTNSDFYKGSLRLSTNAVGYHTYKLLVINGKGQLFDTKPYMCVIEGLANIGFPFMRICNNDSLNVYGENQNTFDEMSF